MSPEKGSCHSCAFQADYDDPFIEGSIEVEIEIEPFDGEYETVEEYMLICPICRENQW